MNRATYQALLARDEESAFSWERFSEEESRERALRPPTTTLGAGRGRFWYLLKRLIPHMKQEHSICDFGAYPGTALRLLTDTAAGGRLAAAGFGFSDEFRKSLAKRSVAMLEMEFDVRRPAAGVGHIPSYPLDRSGGAFEVGICTEVLEHQVYPLSLLIGLNRFLADGARLYLTTNSVSFIGDIIKLIAGRHNVEPVEHSHVLCDTLWRPHIRLYTLREIERLLQACGFVVDEAFYFDNGNVYRGLKSIMIGPIRTIASCVPHLRSHLFLSARKEASPSESALHSLAQQVQMYGLEDELSIDTSFVALHAG